MTSVGKVQTVLGPIDSQALGVTLTHEHMLLDATPFSMLPMEASARGVHYRDPYARAMFDVSAAIEEVNLYKQYGGASLVECTPIDLARDPVGLARISRATGVNVVMGTAYYVSHTHPDDMDSRSEDDIVQEIVGDVTVGARTSRWEFVAATPSLVREPTGIRSGVIGEVGCSWPIADNERKVLRASGRAQRLTGAPVLVHPGRDETAPLQALEVLDGAGADLGRVIIGHLDRTVFQKSTLERIAESGCYLEWDLFGTEQSFYNSTTDMPSDAKRMDDIAWIISRGYGDRVLVAHDTESENSFARNGGHGYFHILADVVPRMRGRGYTEEAIEKILVGNPRDILTFARPKAG